MASFYYAKTVTKGDFSPWECSWLFIWRLKSLMYWIRREFSWFHSLLSSWFILSDYFKLISLQIWRNHLTFVFRISRWNYSYFLSLKSKQKCVLKNCLIKKPQTFSTYQELFRYIIRPVFTCSDKRFMKLPKDSCRGGVLGLNGEDKVGCDGMAALLQSD